MGSGWWVGWVSGSRFRLRFGVLVRLSRLSGDWEIREFLVNTCDDIPEPGDEKDVVIL